MTTTSQPTTAQTAARFFKHDTELVVSTTGAASISTPADRPSDTRPAKRLISRFNSYMLPLATAAAFAAPVPIGEIRRRSLIGAANTHYLQPDAFLISDGWSYTTETADYAHVMMLNDLLSLSTSEGLILELDE